MDMLAIIQRIRKIWIYFMVSNVVIVSIARPHAVIPNHANIQNTRNPGRPNLRLKGKSNANVTRPYVHASTQYIIMGDIMRIYINEVVVNRFSKPEALRAIIPELTTKNANITR